MLPVNVDPTAAAAPATATARHFLDVASKPSNRVRELQVELSRVFLENRARIFWGGHSEEVRLKLLSLAAELRANADAIYGHSMTRFAYGLPSRRNLQAACREINAMATRYPGEDTPISLIKEREKALDVIQQLADITTKH